MSRLQRRGICVAITGAFAMVILAACATHGSGEVTTSSTAIPPPTASTGDTSHPPTRLIGVVASTNVWADIAARIGGQYVQVTSEVTDPAVDPRSFRPGAQEQVAVSAAELIVKNGGGYDDWMNSLVASNSSAALINAVDASVLVQIAAPPGRGPTNSYIWFDLPTAGRVGQTIADRLSALRPGWAPYFQSTAAGFAADITRLTGELADIRNQYAGTPIALADPVAQYLTEAAGLVDKAPPQLGADIDQGRDVPDAVLADTLALIDTDQVAAVVFNSPSTAPAIDQIVGAAADRDIPVAGISATLPAGKDYVGWVDDAIANLADAIAA